MVVGKIKLSERQEKIIDLVKKSEPITGEQIARQFGVTRAALRSDLAVLTISGILDARPKAGYFYSGMESANLAGERIKNKKISEIMSVPVIVTQETSVYDTIVTFFMSDIGSVFVVDDEGSLCGIVSRKDLLKVMMSDRSAEKLPVGIVMTRKPNIITAQETDSVIFATRQLVDHGIYSLPVVQEVQKEGKKIQKVVGRFSKSNIAEFFLELVDE